MNIHEYQAKSLLTKFGVAVPKGGIAYTPQEAETVAKSLAGPVYVVKSQIHAGGRGAGKFKGDEQGKGGVRLVKSPADAAKEAQAMLGHVLVTKQTGPKGREVKRIYVEDGCDIKRELYLGMLIDRKTSRVTVMASTEGGMEIEEVAAKTPEKILKIAIDPVTGMEGFHPGALHPADRDQGQLHRADQRQRPVLRENPAVAAGQAVHRLRHHRDDQQQPAARLPGAARLADAARPQHDDELQQVRQPAGDEPVLGPGEQVHDGLAVRVDRDRLQLVSDQESRIERRRPVRQEVRRQGRHDGRPAGAGQPRAAGDRRRAGHLDGVRLGKGR